MTAQTDLENRYIVVGVDSSQGSRAALGWALTQARLTGAAVEAVAAWQQPATYEYSYGALPFPSPGDGIAAITEKILAETVAEVVGTAAQPVDVRIKVAHGPAAQVLLEAAAGAELLVVGSRGHGAFAGMLLGSVSQHCTQHAPCPVIVIPDAGKSTTIR
ncbi:nucleotide-binding universal stress UspA family protein [Actinoplanes tereljensis]|uniref:Universal stress protein n=1 Tax=Paractinoplanes tereljensis TaxID=571912 RepID=A0A919NIP6_9ACTN|nr:universal stress protein [Actinoplanes tereljensis]GIF18840.1 universal stress protein [Actinoplanes tereljensis]